jgi:hypothetical protein
MSLNRLQHLMVNANENLRRVVDRSFLYSAGAKSKAHMHRHSEQKAYSATVMSPKSGIKMKNFEVGGEISPTFKDVFWKASRTPTSCAFF